MFYFKKKLWLSLMTTFSSFILVAQNVGIGTTNPTQKLHVVGNARITALGGVGRALVTTDNNGVLSTTAFTGNTKDILNGNGVFISIDSLSDKDWLVSGNNMTSIPTGNVGIGVANPGERFVVHRDQDVSSEIGRVHLGYMGYNDWAGFSHLDINGAGGYALMQSPTGQTLLNAASNQTINFRQNNVDQALLESDGDLAMVGDNSFKQPNNVRYAKVTNIQGHNSNNSWWYLTPNTTSMNVEPGNIIKMEATFLARMRGGIGNDDYDYKVYSTGTCGIGDHNVVDGYRPDESIADHDNFKPISYLDYYVVPNCTGTMSFRLEIRNTGDDDYEVKDVVFFVTKY